MDGCFGSVYGGGCARLTEAVQEILTGVYMVIIT